MADYSVRVEGGKLVLDDPTGRGEALALVLEDGGDSLDAREREQLQALLTTSASAAREGRVRPASALAAELLARHRE